MHMRSVAISMRPGFNPGNCCRSVLGSEWWDNESGLFLTPLMARDSGFLRCLMRRRLVVSDGVSPILNILDSFASLIIVAHFVLRAVRAVLSAGLVFVCLSSRRAG